MLVLILQVDWNQSIRWILNLGYTYWLKNGFCECMCVCVTWVQRPEEGIRSSLCAIVIGELEVPDINAGNQIQSSRRAACALNHWDSPVSIEFSCQNLVMKIFLYEAKFKKNLYVKHNIIHNWDSKINILLSLPFSNLFPWHINYM